MSDYRDVETELRTSLAERARHAPTGDHLAEQILADVRARPAMPIPHRRRAWRTWTLPVIAAGAVAAVAGSLVGVNHYRQTSQHQAPAVSHPVPAPSPSETTNVTAPTTSPRESARKAAPAAVASIPGLTHFEIIDLSWVGDDDGWALAYADCLDGSAGPCTAMAHTTDGGRTWHSVKPPAANVPLQVCANPCVEHIRFANDDVGYVFSSTALFMTTDGGSSWHAERGGADALETLDGNVIRVTTSPACTPPGCRYVAETAAVGSSAWHTVVMPVSTAGSVVGVSLARTGRRAFIELIGHTAGGAGDARSTLYVSADDGATWTTRGEPCPQTGGGAAGNEVDSAGLVAAEDGSVSMLCTPRGGTNLRPVPLTSSDGGAHFHSGSPAPTTDFSWYLAAASAKVLVLFSDHPARSTDGGLTWAPIASAAFGASNVTFMGFESPTVGRVVSGDRSTMWTTRDAGQSWSRIRFP